MQDDKRWMRRAIALSRRGLPAPNPHVGCVIVRNGVAVGEGWHHYAGAPHAEREALAVAKEKAQGATAYVTLEPCNHFGRTPPCTLGLIEAGIRRVVFAVSDPNPTAAGGVETLTRAGIEVESGLLATEAAEVNEQFLFAFTHKRPRVVIKAASSLDGRIALPSGESKWITGPEARRAGHLLRVECGAVLVGRRTVELDDPHLTARIKGVRNQPLRVVLDPHGRLTGKERVFDDAAETMHVVGPIDLPNLLSKLFARKVHGLLVEGGGSTIAGFAQAGLIDRAELFFAPKVLGDGASWMGPLALSSLSSGPSLEFVRQKRIGKDLWISARWLP